MIRLSRSEEVDLSSKRKHTVDGKRVSSVNGEVNSAMKKHKYEEKTQKSDVLIHPTRLQPHRAARFTESYSGTSSPDVVLVSDDEKKTCQDSGESSSDSDCEMIPLSPPKELSNEELMEYEQELRQLQVQLRNEEIKLLLLKKLKRSQAAKVNKLQTASPVISSAHIRPHFKITIPPAKGTSVTVTSVIPSKHLLPTNKQQAQICNEIPAPEKNSNNVVSKQTLIKPNVTIQPVNSSLRNKESSVTSNEVKNAVSVNKVPVVSTSQSSLRVERKVERIDSETLAQRQAAAKLNLRKQLEKTLLMIPPPKPLPLQFNFVPNANSTEFMYLLGLDIVVDFITKVDKPSYLPKQPFYCLQCLTNFTTCWRYQDKKVSTKKELKVICEACAISNKKKALKAEYTNKLKAAFVKALQQEKEIERLTQSFSLSPSISVVPVYSNSPGDVSNSPSIINSSLISLQRAAAAKDTARESSNNFVQHFPKSVHSFSSFFRCRILFHQI